ncbi:MEKHLA domain-containing protein [Aurantiacibacter gilvus]|uniref:MEKHLA domain-containing protein n=1 Tax=Aurantiacibacter gilvus TaxID=3139141 RepID=A0ABU9IEC3_9SPHN
MSAPDQKIVEDCAGDRLDLLLSSYERLVGQPLAASSDELWHNPAAVVAHGTEDDPLFCYGNACALTLFKMRAGAFVGMPSQQSAEPEHQDERAAMLARLEADDVVTGYSGVRIAADGSRFRINDAVIWNIRDENGGLHGQAAWFEDMDFLD